MEGLFLLKDMLLLAYKMYKIDLKDALQFSFQGNPESMSDSSGKALNKSFVAFASGFLQLLWSLQSY